MAEASGPAGRVAEVRARGTYGNERQREEDRGEDIQGCHGLALRYRLGVGSLAG